MKMEIELTQDQAEKVKVLEENGMSVGDAVDALFEMKDILKVQTATALDYRLEKANKQKAQLEERMQELDEEISLFNKLKDTSLDSEQKIKMVEKEYGTVSKTYDESVQDAKHEFKWTKSIFKF